MAEVAFECVRKSYGAKVVIPGLDLTVRAGEFFTVVGPSGCGKSTLLALVAGLEPVDAGAIRFDGEAVQALDPKDRNVAMVFQSYALYPHMSVFENLAFPLRVRGARRADVAREVRRVAELLEIGDLLERRPRALSGGQRQRVALGRAIVRRPRVYLLDEPLSNLDAALRLSTRARLRRLHAELGTTMLYVTHDQEEAMALSDRVAVLRSGVVAQCAPPRELYARPANRFVARFIGSPPMNLLAASVVSRVPFLADFGTAHSDRRVEVGIRPEDVEIVMGESNAHARADVVLAEDAGPHQWVTVRLGDAEIKARAPSEVRVAPGESVELRFAAERIHAFDAASGARVE